MKVQELIDRLADFRADAEVTFWHHDPSLGEETMFVLTNVDRDNSGNVAINWSENANDGHWSRAPIVDV